MEEKIKSPTTEEATLSLVDKKPLEIFKTKADLTGRDITQMSNFFDGYIEQMSLALREESAIEVLSEIPISDLILGLYVFCALKDYNVLGNFSDLQDISLKEAHNMRDLSFMANLSDWFMLFIQGASLPNLDPLMHTEGFKKNRHSYCLGLYDCHIKDTSSLINSNLHLYELLIWNKWSKFENERWRKANALVYYYYRLDSAKN